jgi:hypothetical protein
VVGIAVQKTAEREVVLYIAPPQQHRLGDMGNHHSKRDGMWMPQINMIRFTPINFEKQGMESVLNRSKPKEIAREGESFHWGVCATLFRGELSAEMLFKSLGAGGRSAGCKLTIQRKG